MLRVFSQDQQARRLREEEAKQARLRALSTIDLTTVSEDSVVRKDTPSQRSKGMYSLYRSYVAYPVRAITQEKERHKIQRTKAVNQPRNDRSTHKRS